MQNRIVEFAAILAQASRRLPAPLFRLARNMGTEGAQLVASLFGTADSVHTRFPGLHGVLLQEAIWTAYAIEKNASFPFLTADADANVVRHRLNDRDQRDTVEALAASVEKQGGLVGVRGLPWAVKPDGDGPYQMLTWGHFCDGVIVAAARSPENPYVLATLKKGVVNATVFNASTPDDVLLYLIRLHNDFHQGASGSFLDLLSDLKTLEQRWSIHRRTEKIVARGGTGDSAYAIQYWKWVQTARPGFAQTWQQYESWKAVLGFLDRHKFYSDLRTHFNMVTNFMDPRIKNDVVMSMFHHAITLLNKVFPTVPLWIFKHVHFELYKFFVPVRVNARGG
jgi:hypothetical protein